MFTLQIKTDNEAFKHGAAAEHTAELLRGVADKLNRGDENGAIFDGNGNRVGEWVLFVTEEEDDEPENKSIIRAEASLLTTQGRKVIVSREAIALFNATWPASPLSSDRHYWFEFDADGDLIDTDVPEHSDGDAASALADDCKAYLFDDNTPEWI